MNKRVLMLLPLLVSSTAFAETAYVNAPEGLNVRAEASTESAIIETLPFGNQVDGIISGDWMKLANGYARAEYLQPEEPMEYLGTWRITAYAYTGSPCANGNYPQTGYTIACNSLSFGTQIYIDGVGVRTVEDRGPSWLGSEWCDLYLGDTSSCIAWGDQHRDVYLVKGGD